MRSLFFFSSIKPTSQPIPGPSVPTPRPEGAPVSVPETKPREPDPGPENERGDAHG